MFVALRSLRHQQNALHDFRLEQRQRQAVGISVTSKSTSPSGWLAEIHNPSNAPIFGCALNTDGVKVSIGTVAAGDTVRPRFVGDRPRYIDIGFTDSDGRYWIRRWTGSLIQVPLPAEGIDVVWPQAFEIAEWLDPRPKGFQPSDQLDKRIKEWAKETRLLDVRNAERARRKGDIYRSF